MRRAAGPRVSQLLPGRLFSSDAGRAALWASSRVRSSRNLRRKKKSGVTHARQQQCDLLRMYTSNAAGAQNVKCWSARAHAFKVTRRALRALLYVCVRVTHVLKMFMVGASSDGCVFAAAASRSAEVAAAVCGAIQLLSSWEPVQQVHTPNWLLSAAFLLSWHISVQRHVIL